MSNGVIRVECDGALEFLFRAGPIPDVICVHESQREMRFAERVIKIQRLESGLFGGRITRYRGAEPVVGP